MCGSLAFVVAAIELEISLSWLGWPCEAMACVVELRAVSSYLIAVVAIMKRCRDRHLHLSSTAFVGSNFYLPTCEL